MSAGVDRASRVGNAYVSQAPLDGADVALAWARAEASSDVTRRASDGTHLEHAERVREHATIERLADERSAEDAREDEGAFSSIAADLGEVATVAAVVGATVAVPGGGVVAVAALASAGLEVGSVVAAHAGASDGVVTGLAVGGAVVGLAAGGAGALSGAATSSSVLSTCATSSRAVGGAATMGAGYAKLEAGRADARALEGQAGALGAGRSESDARAAVDEALANVRASHERARAAFTQANGIAETAHRGVHATVSVIRG